MEKELKSLYEAILKGNTEQSEESVHIALKNGVAPEHILNDILIPAMTEVGRLFENGEYFVPEMLIAARAMQGGAMKELRPLLVESDIQPKGKVIIGTVQGDLHDIGKNLVGMMLEGAGFDIQDLGTDVNPEEFLNEIKNSEPDIVAMSALLTTTMPKMETTIEAIKDAGLRDKVKVIVGGAPVTQEFATKIGADGYASDASRAAKLANSLIQG